MRLINCQTLEVEQFFDLNIPDYAILSHTWGSDEVTFADLPLHQAPATSRAGYRKIKFICEQALENKVMYGWVDTCCIDKSSSAELSEAINSMWVWYWASSGCYVFLEDVTEDTFEETFPQSRWFTRGWTVQELLAPKAVGFFDCDGKWLGSRRKLAEWISEITTIDAELLIKGAVVGRKLRGGVSLGSFCVAKRMSWAARRSTTRVEDTAYCLLGLFGINMPLLYGEGERAFIRLQQEIMRSVDDDSILAWGLDPGVKLLPRVQHDPFNDGGIDWMGNILANSPEDFEMCGNVEYAAPPIAPFALTNVGLQIQLPLAPVLLEDVETESKSNHAYVGLLSCSLNTGGNMIGILLDTVVEGQSITDMGRTFARTDEDCCYTVLVSPLVATKAKTENITIVRNNDVRYHRLTHKFYSARGWRHIVVHLSQRFQQMGYRAAHGQDWYYDGATGRLEMWEREGVDGWNAASKVYSFRTRFHHQHLLRFAFESEPVQSESQFSVFMLTTGRRTITRRGAVFSESDLFSIGSQLEDPHSLTHPEKLLLSDNDGTSFDLDVEVTEEKQIYRWCMSNVNVDVAGLELELSSLASTQEVLDE